MFSTPHATTAVLLSAATGNPVAAFCIGALSHIVLDAVPHGDRRFFRMTIDNEGFPQFNNARGRLRFNIMGFAELVFAALVIWRIITALHLDPLITGMAAFGAVVPDLLIPIVHLPFIPKAITRFYDIGNYSIHMAIKKTDLPWKVGFSLQFAYTVIILLLIFMFRGV